jgi:hypothetical protein
MLTRKSTSLHTINGDKGLGKFRGRLYSLCNIVNGFFPYGNVAPALELRDFVVPDLSPYGDLFDTTASPGRVLSDLFWMTLPWQRIREELHDIHILDTGCGSGSYALKLRQWSRGTMSAYTGLDTSRHDAWADIERQTTGVRFYLADSSAVLDHLHEEANLFISQSAIEHFKHDIEYFKQLARYIEITGREVLQVHLFPAAACRTLYGYHGIRQYTARTVSKISRLFKMPSYALLYRLGGEASKRLHGEFITSPRRNGRGDLRSTRQQEYSRRLFEAVSSDMQSPQKDPLFFALIIHSHWHQKLF